MFFSLMKQLLNSVRYLKNKYVIDIPILKCETQTKACAVATKVLGASLYASVAADTFMRLSVNSSSDSRSNAHHGFEMYENPVK